MVIFSYREHPPKDRNYQSFDSARMYARSLGLTSKTEWEKYCRAHEIPMTYQLILIKYQDKGWSGWGDWIGTGSIAARNGMVHRQSKRVITILIESGAINRWTEVDCMGYCLQEEY